MHTVRLALALVIVFAAGADAVEITRYDFDDNVVGGRNLSFAQSPVQGAFHQAGDAFEVLQVDVSPEIPDQFLDETTAGHPSDELGVVNSHPVAGKLDAWFGIVDLRNPDNTSGTGTITWEFDISGFSDISVSVDMAAMGDFDFTGAENPDAYDWTWSIDGGVPVALFTSSINEDISLDYTMASGKVVNYTDPMLMNGTCLNNNFQTISGMVVGTGDVLTVTLNGESDGHNEVYAFDDIVIEGVPEPAMLVLVAVGGLTVIRRRR